MGRKEKPLEKESDNVKAETYGLSKVEGLALPLRFVGGMRAWEIF